MIRAPSARLWPLARMLNRAVDVQNQRFELMLEKHIVVRATQSPLIAEFIESDSAHRAGPLIELRELLGGLIDVQLLRECAGQRWCLLARLRLHQVQLCMHLAKVKFDRSTSLRTGKFCDVKGSWLFAMLAFHFEQSAIVEANESIQTRFPRTLCDRSRSRPALATRAGKTGLALVT